MTIITRRNFFGLAGAAVCAPAIVRFTSLMPVRSFIEVEAFSLLAGSLNYANGFLVPDEFIRQLLLNARTTQEMMQASAPFSVTQLVRALDLTR